MDSRIHHMLHTIIGSVWCLELLLLLKGDTGRRWNPALLVSELRSNANIVDSALDRLERAGLVDRDSQGAAGYSPANAELDDLVRRIEEEYRLRPDSVRRAIVLGPDDKLRSFADAFILRKGRS